MKRVLNATLTILIGLTLLVAAYLYYCGDSKPRTCAPQAGLSFSR